MTTVEGVPPLLLDVYTKTFVRVGRVGAPISVTVTPKVNAIGTATVSIMANDVMAAKLLADGARVVIIDPQQSYDDGVVMSGRVDGVRGSGDVGAELIEFDIIDDFCLFNEVLGWVIPTAPITGQGTAGQWWTSTGPAETVLRNAVVANAVTRLGLPVNFPASQGRGSTVTAKLRFDPLSELFETGSTTSASVGGGTGAGAGIGAAGIIVSVKQIAGQLRVIVRTPKVYTRVLTPDSGEVISWGYNMQRPTATRVVIGGQGEAQARALRTKADATRETQIGWIIERWRDARDVDAGADQDSNLYARGQETLDEGAAKVGLSLSLAETEAFKYGKNVTVGDTVSLQIAGLPLLTDVLSEVKLSWTREDGWKRAPQVGQRSDSTDISLIKAVANIARKLAKGTRG